MTEDDIKRLAEATARVQHELGREERELMAAQLRELAPLIPLVPLIEEHAKAMAERRELYKRIGEKVLGTFILGALLVFLGWLGRAAITELAKEVSNATPNPAYVEQVVDAEHE